MSLERYRHSLITIAAALFVLLLAALTGCRSVPEETAKAAPEREKRPAKEVDTYQEIRQAIQKGEPKRALESFEQRYSDRPRELEAQLLYASLLITNERLEAAERVVREILRAHPEHPEALYDLALIKGIQGKTEEQQELLQQTLAAGGRSAEAHSALGEIYMQKGKLEEASEQFRKSLEIDDENFAAHMGYGHLLLREGEYEQALEHLNRAVALNPTFSLAHADRGKARAKLDKMEAALEDYAKAIELAPDNYWNRIDRGRLLLETGEEEQALEDFKRAAELRPDFFLAYVYLAGLYDDRNAREKALANYEKVMQLNPDYYPVYKPAAILHYLQADYGRAAELFQSEYRRDPRDHGILLMSALCFDLAKRDTQSEKLLGKLMSELGRDSIFYHLARLYDNPNYVDYVMSRLKKVEEKPLEMRALFYLAAFYEREGHQSLARKYYLEVKDANLYGLYETRIAEEKLDGLIEE
jgi:tetratricopeptide (TPR) repeat protein